MKMVWLVYIGIFLSLILLSPGSVLANAKINEFVVEPNPEWVEIYNASSSSEYLKNWWLDDDQDFDNDSGSGSKKSFKNWVEGEAGYVYLEFNSFLNNGGDWVVLFDETGALIDSWHYDKSPGADISYGRSPDYSGDICWLEEPTQGRPNSDAVSSPEPSPNPDPSPDLSPSPSLVNQVETEVESSPSPNILVPASPQASSFIIGKISLWENTDETPILGTSSSILDQDLKLPTKAWITTGLSLILVFLILLFSDRKG